MKRGKGDSRLKIRTDFYLVATILVGVTISALSANTFSALSALTAVATISVLSTNRGIVATILAISATTGNHSSVRWL